MIYLDNAATSWPKAPNVAKAITKAIEEPYGNIGRSSHRPSVLSSSALFQFRSLVQSTLPYTPVEHIIITPSATHALNIAILGSVSKGQTVITTHLEHNAVMRVLDNCNNRVIPLKSDPYGRVLVDKVVQTIYEYEPKVAIINGASNVHGVIQPLEELLTIFREHNIMCILDASQVMGECDIPPIMKEVHGAICFSLHKGLLGPAGCGIMALYGSFSPNPLYFGGTGSSSDSIIQPSFLPDKYESGTLPIPSIIGAIPALEYVLAHKKKIYAHKNKMSDYLYQSLIEIEELRMLSPKEKRVGNITFTTKEGTISSLSQILALGDIACRAGFHCAPLAHTYLGTQLQGGAIRLSIGYTTEIEELDEVVTQIKRGIYESNR